MTPEDEAKSREIFLKAGSTWTKQESNFINALFQKGHRPKLKQIFAEVRQNNPLGAQNNGV